MSGHVFLAEYTGVNYSCMLLSPMFYVGEIQLESHLARHIGDTRTSDSVGGGDQWVTGS